MIEQQETHRDQDTDRDNQHIQSSQLRLSIIVPAYNEAATIERVLQRVLETNPYLFELLVVDDGSHDMTSAIVERMEAAEPRVHLLRQYRNQGKTAALKVGFAASQGDIVVVQDADLEYDPSEIAELINPILTDRADVVYGSRFLVRRAARVLYFRHYLANKFLTFLSNILTDLNLTDVETGYKAFRGDIIRNMVITSDGFGFEIEATAKIAKLHCRIYEVPISYYGRTYEEGKKIGVKDGILAIIYIFVYNLFWSRRRSYRISM